MAGVLEAYLYDHEGNLLRKTTNCPPAPTPCAPVVTGETVYIGGIYERAPNGVVTKYYFVNDQRFAMRAGGVLRFITGDHLGSTSLVTTDTGIPESRTRYYPYGSVRMEEGVSPTDKMFTGQQRETMNGIYHYGVRLYNTDIGRFPQADTITPDTGDPQALNRYSYVYNNPMKYTDPTGHFAVGMCCWGVTQGLGKSWDDFLDGFLDDTLAHLQRLVEYDFMAHVFAAYAEAGWAEPPILIWTWDRDFTPILTLAELLPTWRIGDIISGARFLSSCLNGPCDMSAGIGAIPGPDVLKLAKLRKAFGIAEGVRGLSPRVKHLTDLSGYRKQFDKLTLQGAMQELAGIPTIVGGRQWDHIGKVRKAQGGLVKRINNLIKASGDPNLSGYERASVNLAIGEASRLLTYSRKFVPRR